jgi:hypothetical protein
MLKKLKKSAGQVSTILLVLAVVLIVLVIAVFVVLKINASKTAATVKKNAPVTQNMPPKPVYDTSIGDVRFVFESAQDLGNILIGRDQTLKTTERFIKIIIGAQNTGKFDIQQYSWDIGNIIDGDGRNFVSIDNQAYDFLPNPNLCQSTLKPDFTPVPCIKFYEVSKASTKLKVEVNTTDPNTGRKKESFLDLVVIP